MAMHGLTVVVLMRSATLAVALECRICWGVFRRSSCVGGLPEWCNKSKVH
jgi:hypothetical protein